LRAAYVADGSQYTDPAPVDPSPVDPVEPSDSTVAITVHDNGSVSSVTVKPGSVSLTYAGAAGMRFAGWFTDAACTVPADLTNVLSDMTVYAKYVSDSYLTVKYAERGWFRVTGISLVSAVDSRSYADTGFVINGETVSATSYSSRYGFYTAGYLFGSGVDRNAPLMSYDYSLPSMSDGDTISVTPYWVTLDGTTVYGTTRTLTYYRFGLVG
ncbi:MAG: InlB B-repeat-containing protein, partial [Eubacteriales bacterium]